ncbi:citrate synthase-like protein [Aspergillus varians]
MRFIKRDSFAATEFKKIKALGVGTNRAGQVSSGLRVHDPGLLNTTVVESAISFSMLLFRGYSLEGLWSMSQKEDVRLKLAKHILAVRKTVQKAVQAMPPLRVFGLHPQLNPRVNRRKLINFTLPSLDKTSCENLFIVGELVDPAAGSPDPVKLPCFRRLAMLNADHGMAPAVFSALVTASSPTDPISCLITSVTSAWGALHFGATESAQQALTEIATVDRIPAFLDEVKQGHKKLFGYGHRSYKGIDPRVRPIQSILKDLPSTHLVKLAEAIEQSASGNEYFRSRGLFPNADFYGNFVFTGIGFELEMIPAAMLAQRIMGHHGPLAGVHA